MTDEVLFDLGTIRKVVLDPERAVFLDVELAHHSRLDGRPLVGRCRLVVPYHGDGYGDWHVPDVGTVILCFFPGYVAGGDMDDGYAIGFAPAIPRPPVNGLGGPLSAARRVFKGKLGVAYDRHIQADHALRVDGNETRHVQGTLTRTINGSETSTNVGAVQRLFSAAAEWIGSARVRVQSAAQLLLRGTVEVEITSDALIELNAPLIQLIATTVEAGVAGATKRLVHETFISLFNAHTHSGSAIPDQQAAVGTHTTTKLRGDG